MKPPLTVVLLLVAPFIIYAQESLSLDFAPSVVKQGETVDIQISFVAHETEPRMIEIWFKENGNIHAHAKFDVEPGAHSLTVPMSVSVEAPPLEGEYGWSLYMAKRNGGNWQSRVASAWLNNCSVTEADALPGPEPESVSILSTPAEIVAGENTPIELSYVADVPRDIEVWLKDATDSNRIRGQARQTVGAGNHTITFQIPVDGDSPPHSSYHWSAYIGPVGGSWSTRIDDDWRPNNRVIAPVVVDPLVPAGPVGTRTNVDYFKDMTIDFGPANNGSPVWYRTGTDSATIDLSNESLHVVGITNESVFISRIDTLKLDLAGDFLELKTDIRILAAPMGGDELFRLGLINGSGTPLEDNLTTVNNSSTALGDDLGYGVAIAVGSGHSILFREGGTDSGLLQGADLTRLSAPVASALTVGQTYSLTLRAERLASDQIRLSYALGDGEVLSAVLDTDLIDCFDSVAFTTASADLHYELDNLIITAYDQNAVYNRYTNYPRHIEAKRYNVLFIAVDDLKPLGGLFSDHNHHSSIDFPNAITPNMDRLAAEGMNFRNNYCQVAVCAASRISTLTGLRPDSTLSWNYNDRVRDLRPDVVTLPQHFGAYGYVTHSIGKIFHHEDADSWNDGYQRPKGAKYFYASPAAEIEDGTHPTITWGTDWGAYSTDKGEYERDGSPVTDDSYTDGQSALAAEVKIAEYAANYINNGQPFFLGVGFHKPHLPYTAPKAYWDLYDPADIDATDYVTPGADADPWLVDTYEMPDGTPRFARPGNSRANSGEFNTYWDTNHGRNPGNLYRKETAERIVHGYLACVSYADAQVGRLLDALEASGVADDTIIVLWSDHGWHLADHKGFWGKHTNFQQATITPMLMKIPGMDILKSAGTETWAMTELVDIYPTLLDIVDLPKPQMPDGLELEGTSLLPLIQDPSIAWKRAAFSQFPENIFNDKIDGDGDNRESFTFANPQRNVNLDGQWLIGPGMGYSIRTQRYRYTEYWQTRTDEKNDNGYIINRHIPVNNTPQIAELYDYLADPAETVNLAYEPAYADVVNELKAALAIGNGWARDDVKTPAYAPADLSAWKAAHAAPGQDANWLDDIADPDFDQLPNLIEYKLGTHPLEPNASVPFIHVDAGEFVLTFSVEEGRNDVSIEVQRGRDLTEPASWTNQFPQAVLKQRYGSKEAYEIRVPIEPGNESNFFRLKAQ